MGTRNEGRSINRECSNFASVFLSHIYMLSIILLFPSCALSVAVGVKEEAQTLVILFPGDI